MATKDTESNPITSPAEASAAPSENVQVNYLEVITQAGDTVLENIAATQEQFLKSAQSLAESLPKTPEVTVPAFELPKLDVPGFELPNVEVPSARELAEVGFKFADKYLANQKAYTEKLLALAGA